MGKACTASPAGSHPGGHVQTHTTQGGCDTRNCACVCWGGGPSFRFPPRLHYEATPVILVSFPDQLNSLFLRSQRIPMYKDSIYLLKHTLFKVSQSWVSTLSLLPPKFSSFEIYAENGISSSISLPTNLPKHCSDAAARWHFLEQHCNTKAFPKEGLPTASFP